MWNESRGFYAENSILWLNFMFYSTSFTEFFMLNAFCSGIRKSWAGMYVIYAQTAEYLITELWLLSVLA